MSPLQILFSIVLVIAVIAMIVTIFVRILGARGMGRVLLRHPRTRGQWLVAVWILLALIRASELVRSPSVWKAAELMLFASLALLFWLSARGSEIREGGVIASILPLRWNEIDHWRWVDDELRLWTRSPKRWLVTLRPGKGLRTYIPHSDEADRLMSGH